MVCRGNTKAPTKMAKVYRQRRGIILKTNIFFFEKKKKKKNN